MYSKITRRISRSLPYIRATNYLRAYFDKSNPYFVGWGMTTHSYPPWHLGEGDPFSKKFYATNNNFMSMVRNGTFQLTQLRRYTVDERKQFVRGRGDFVFGVMVCFVECSLESQQTNGTN